jgi:hypothetical protein
MIVGRGWDLNLLLAFTGLYNITPNKLKLSEGIIIKK